MAPFDLLDSFSLFREMLELSVGGGLDEAIVHRPMLTAADSPSLHSPVGL